MQEVTPWPDSFDVSEPVARVLIDGQEVDVESVTVTSELGSAMPERVAAGGGGLTATTGTARLFRPGEVTDAGFNPWGDARPFVDASEVVVEAGYVHPETGVVSCVRQATGQAEGLSGSALDGGVGMDFVDHTPSLDRDITIEPLLQEYPPLEDWGPRRGAGLSPTYITDRILRHCGFYATPPMIDEALLSAPMMGSAVPERGTLVSARAQTSGVLAAVFSPVSWGMGLGNGSIAYRPDWGARGHAFLTSTLHVSFHRWRSLNPQPGDGVIELRWGTTNVLIRIRLFATGVISVQYVQDGVATTAVAMPSHEVNASESFTILIEPSGQATIHASNGSSISRTIPLPQEFAMYSMDEIFVHVPQTSHRIGGLQVAFSSDLLHTFQRTAHIDPPVQFNQQLRAFPAQIDANCLRLLKDQAEAELAAMWIDERGHFRWRNRNYLRNSAPVGTLTSKQDIFDLPWNVPVRSVYSRVEVEHDVPTATIRDTPSITVSDSRGQTLSDGEEEAKFFEPPAGQDWHQVTTPQWIAGAINHWALRRGRGSYMGGIVVDEENNERLAYSSRLSQSWAQIGPQKWLLTSEARNLGEEEYIEQAFRDRTDRYGQFAGEGLPVIRAKGITEWDTHKIVGTMTGPELAPVFVHTVGPWIQPLSSGQGELVSLADWLAEELTRPAVILRDIPIVPDPRIQLGDVFWLHDEDAYDVRLKIVVMGKTLQYQASQSGHEMSQTITCRVLDVERTKITYTELDTTWDNRDYAALAAAWHRGEYQDLEAHPLDRRPQ